MYLLEDLEKKYKQDPLVKDQLEKEFGDYISLESEFDKFWNNTHMSQIINESSLGNGKIAGAGAIDYNESKIVYMFIRTYKPNNVLEIGHASGCSSVIIAKALEKNGNGNLYTCDIKDNCIKKPSNNFISGFEKYMKNGIIKATGLVDAIDYVKDHSNIKFEIIFTDASHEPEFCYSLTKLLKKYWPNALNLYHEWAMSPLANEKEKSYVSLMETIQHQTLAERIAFLTEFPIIDYEHYGFYGSCGLGVVKPRGKNNIDLKVYYRLSNKEAGISKKKILNATKDNCLKNCIEVFGKENITIIGDNLNLETKNMVLSFGLKLVEVNNQNGAGTFRDALDLAIEENNDDQFVYLLEDDFLHKQNSKEILLEGLLKYNTYTTLYDHPDKYLNKEDGGNPYIEEEGEITRLVKTPSTHWKITNSTVMSFASSISRLKQDKNLLLKYSQGNITDSFGLFCELSQTKGIAVLSSIPGYSTHCESMWLSPLTKWETITN